MRSRRGWVALCFFLVALLLGFYGPVFLAKRRSELEVRAWYRAAQAEPLPWERAEADERRIAQVSAVRLALKKAYEASDELSTDSFPSETITAFLEHGALDAREGARETGELQRLLDGVLDAPAEPGGDRTRRELLRDAAYRWSRIPEPTALEGSSVHEHMAALEVWVDFLLFRAAADPGAPGAAERLGLALDLARISDNGVLIGYFSRGYLEGKVYETVHLLLRHGAISPTALRVELEPRLIRNASLAHAPQAIASERLFLVEALAQFAGSEPICAGFSGDYRPVVGIIEALEEARVTSRATPPEYLAQALHESSELSGHVALECLSSMHTHLALGEMLRVELALAVFREREGAWPDDLSKLAPMFPQGLPFDPHAQARFRYVRLGNERTAAGERSPGGIVLGPPAIAALHPRGEELVRSLP